MKVVGIIQARTGSTRLPSKVLMPLGNRTVLEVVIERVRAACNLDQVIVATTVEPRDQGIAELCERLNILCTRGSESDVLERYYQSAKQYGADAIIRVTSDCPLVDSNTIDEIVRIHRALPHYDYILKDKMPIGLTSELFTMKALEDAFMNMNADHHREHIVTAFTEYTDRYRSFIYECPGLLNNPQLRLTLDTREDYELLSTLFHVFSESAPLISVTEVVAFMNNQPELKALNDSTKNSLP
ncbi:glycosyltransferase family protein [Paenibacillus radicis (ex Xue et al. 2023)]|uniref:Glycosyltransferase family protein n=1 Tax=Paenibacillus radicis (ex Xue et al. 2023) TaxID=2972489 RepID=A0ABT1YGR3_9BACL|nr:glycosyltransferase family protein [Paenibacillus radicis (ex Xue et al. 2023)]MCR8632386.1 glycosyltransferase family protein [Paenibacillus radicis (ex Xue et al. 2023)]